MGLDVVMLGSPTLREMKADPAAEPDFRMLILYCAKEYPQAGTVDIKDPAEVVSEGHQVGAYSDLHILRGLALASEQSADKLDDMTENDLAAIAEKFYAKPQDETAYPNLINHPDDSGYYVPFELPSPMVIEGIPRGYDEKVSITFGSSVGLLAELERVNHLLQLPGDLGELGADAFTALAEKHRWPTAAYVWGVLRLYARESLERPGFIQFC